MANNGFIRELLTDKSVLGRARTIAAARILCRRDIVRHVMAHRSDGAGALWVHLRAIVGAAESAMWGRDVKRFLGNMSNEQKAFVWAAFVDGYARAAKMAGRPIRESEAWDYMVAAQRMARAMGLKEPFTALDDVRRLMERTMARIQPQAVLLGGWERLREFQRSEWFRKDCALPLELLEAAFDRTIPEPLRLVLRSY